MADLLEYLIRVAGGAEAATQVREVRTQFEELGASAKGAGAEMAGAEGASGKLGAAFGMASRGGAALAIAVAASGAAVVKMSNSFNTEMLKIRTEGGASAKELQNMKSAVLQLAASGQSMGQGPTALAEGLYHLESMGLRSHKALMALKDASQESAISGANLEDTTTSLGGALFIAAKGTGSLSHLMGTLNAIAGAGNMRFQDLNEALGTGVLGAAKVAGVSLQEMGAALGVLTDSGYKASSAAAQLGTAMHYLYSPTEKGEGALESIHLSGNKLAADLRKPQGLLVALRDLRDHMTGMSKVQQADVLNQILPGGRGRVLLNLYSMQNRLAPKYQQITGTARDFGQHVAEQRQNPSTQLATAVAQVQANMVKLGNVLAPIVVPALAKFISLAAQGIGVLSNLVPRIGQLFSGGGIASGGSFLGKLIGSYIGYFNQLKGVVVDLWGSVKPAFAQIWAAAKQAFGGQFGSSLLTIIKDIEWLNVVIGKTLLGVVQHALPGIVSIFRGAFKIISGLVGFVADVLTGKFGAAFTQLRKMFSGEWEVLKGIIVTLASPITDVISDILKLFNNNLLGPLKTLFQDIVNVAIIGPINDMIKILDKIHVHIPGWIPGVGGHHIGINIDPVGTLGSSGSSAKRVGSQHAVGGTVAGHRLASAGSTGNVMHVHTGDLVIVAPGSRKELARISRRELQNAMMRAA